MKGEEGIEGFVWEKNIDEGKDEREEIKKSECMRVKRMLWNKSNIKSGEIINENGVIKNIIY